LDHESGSFPPGLKLVIDVSAAIFLQKIISPSYYVIEMYEFSGRIDQNFYFDKKIAIRVTRRGFLGFPMLACAE